MSSLGLYLAVALNLFNKDKSAYVFESGLTTAETVSTQVNNFLLRMIKDSLNIYNILVDRQLKPELITVAKDYDEVFPAKQANTKDKVEKNIFDLSGKLQSLSGSQLIQMKVELAAVYLEKAELMRAGFRTQQQGSAKDVGGTEFKAPLRLAVKLFDVEDDDGGDKEAASKSVEHLFVIGQVYKMLADYDNAELFFKEILDKHKDDARVELTDFLLAETLYAKRDYLSAIDQYKKVLRKSKGKRSLHSLYKLVLASGLTGRSKEALTYLEKTRQHWSSFPAQLKTDLSQFAVQVFAETRDITAAGKFYSKVSGGSKYLSAVKNDIELIKAGASAGRGATNLLESRRLLRSLFYGDPDLVEFSIYDAVKKGGSKKESSSGSPERLVRMVNKDYLAESNLGEYYLDRVDEEKPVNFAAVTTERPLFMNSALKGGIGLLTLVRKDPLTGRFLLVRAKMDRFLNMFTQNKVYTTYMINTGGDLFAHKDARRLVDDLNMLEESYITEIVKAGTKVGVREMADRSGTDMIVAYTDVGVFNLMVFSEIKKSRAFLAARELTKKSLYYAIFLISVAIMIGILFAKSLTTPIDVLFKGTKIIAAGDFKTKVTVKSKDEIGVLADSFNFMAGRIVQLLEQEKDKVRMEEELKVAKLVQDSFFPANKVVAGNLDIAAFYTPSSECGGDWWGMLRNGRKTLMMIGDATGHGVPAALITATAASCSITIQEMGKIHSDLLDSPAQILNLLNKAVYGAAQGKILMTFFVCVIDPDQMTVTYSNASHNPPYHYKFDQDAEPSKKDLKVLMEAVGYRLGHKPDAVYENATSEIAADDRIVLFTDGFVECTNPKLEEYGNRKFIKSILKYMKGPTEGACGGIVKDARDFFADQPLADDLTMVVAKVLPDVVSEKTAA